MTENPDLKYKGNKYLELQDQICHSKLPKDKKVGLSLNLFNIFLNEQQYNNEFTSKFEKLKEELTKQVKTDLSKLDITKLKLWNQCTENYRPSMCDSSCYGTSNLRYLRQIETLFTNDTYYFDESGDIIPILWNLATINDYGIQYTQESDKWTRRFLNYCNTSIKKEGYYGQQEINEIPYWRSFDYFIEWIEQVLQKDVEKIRSDNTYNYDGLFVLQFNQFKIDGITFIELEVHIGADVRGGYSDPVIYECNDEDMIAILNSNEDIRFYCNKCNSDESTIYHNEEKRKWNPKKHIWQCQNLISTQKFNKGKVVKQKTLQGKKLKDFKICNGELSIDFL